jgi:serine/threonine protein kinase
MFVALSLTGCARSSTAIPLTHWTLDSEGTKSDVVMPTHLNDRVPSHSSVFTLHTDVDVPAAIRGRDLAVWIPYFQGVVSLSVDGSDAITIDPDLVEIYSTRGPHLWRIPHERTNRSTLALDLTVQNKWTSSSYFDTVPELRVFGQANPLATAIAFLNNAGAAIACVALVQVSATYLAVFLTDRSRRTYFWLAMQGLTAAYYSLHNVGWAQLFTRGYDSAFVSIMVAAAALSSVYFTHALFGLPPPSRFFKWLAATDLLLVCVAPGPFHAQLLGARAAIISIIIVVVYQVTVLIRLMRIKPRPDGALILVAAWLFLGVTAWTDLGAWFSLGEPLYGIRLAGIGLSVFAMLQSLILSRSHTLSLRHADDLNVELAGRVNLLETTQQEITVLNDELRRQITDRSRQLFAALALVGKKTDLMPALNPGEIVQDRYRIVRELGAGGMGSVYEVTRITDDRRLALKVTLGLDSVALARLAREAQIASQVTHPNVVTMFDVDVSALGFLFVVMEYVDGTSLAEQKKRYGDRRWGLEVLRQIAEGLAALHAIGIVHRDLKPANVLLAAEGMNDAPRVKISDFGISRIREAGDRPTRISAVPPSMNVQTVSAHVNANPPPPDAALRDQIITREIPAMSVSSPSSIPPAPLSEPPVTDPTQMLAATTNPELPLIPSVPSISLSRSGSSSLRVFGAASSSTLTQAGHVIGTPTYMAPELTLADAELTPAADMFSLGVLAFEILAKKYPFREPPALARLKLKEVGVATKIQSIFPDLPKPAADLIDACLSLDPVTRPSARVFADGLSSS